MRTRMSGGVGAEGSIPSATRLGITFLIALSSSEIIPSRLRNHHDCESNQQRSDNNIAQTTVSTNGNQNKPRQAERTENNPNAGNDDETAGTLCCLTVKMPLGKQRLELATGRVRGRRNSRVFVRSRWLYACQMFGPTPMMPRLFPRKSISMNRREFAKTIASSTVAVSVPHLLLNATNAAGVEAY